MKQVKKGLFYKGQKSWDTATISFGTYNTKSYWSKDYMTKSGLSKGLKALGYKLTEPYNFETWNSGNKQYQIVFNYN